MKLLRTWITLAAGLALSAAVHAQAFPSKPIRVVVGFPAGGPLDQHARLLLMPSATAKSNCQQQAASTGHRR